MAVRIAQAGSRVEAARMAAIVVGAVGVASEVLVPLGNVGATVRSRSLSLHIIADIASIDAGKSSVQLNAKVVVSNSNDLFIHVLEVVASVLGVEDCLWVKLDEVVQSLSVVDDNGVARGRVLVTSETFNHGGHEAEEIDEGGKDGLHLEESGGTRERLYIDGLVMYSNDCRLLHFI